MCLFGITLGIREKSKKYQTMIHSIFFSAFLLLLLAFSPQVFSQNLTNIGASQQVYASNANPFQGNGNVPVVQNQQGQNQFRGNQRNQVNYSAIQEQATNQVKNDNNETGNFKTEEVGSEQSRATLRLPPAPISFEKRNSSRGIKSMSKIKYNNISLKKMAYKMNKNVKKNFRKNGTKSANGCFSW